MKGNWRGIQRTLHLNIPRPRFFTCLKLRDIKIEKGEEMRGDVCCHKLPKGELN